MSEIKSAFIRALGNAFKVGIQAYTPASAKARKRKGLKGCQPCEAQKRVDGVMREIRGR